MRANRAKDTEPEKLVRSALWAAGIRGYRKHAWWLPGRPDIAFTRWKVAVFVHGCYWHGCPQCWHRRRNAPIHNGDYWQTKISGNRARDSGSIARLEAEGWRVIVTWEHELRGGPIGVVALVREAIYARSP